MTTSEYKKLTQPKLKESDITRAILQYLKYRGIFAWKVFQSLGSVKGVPDILGVLPGGRSLMIEVKAPKGQLRPHQKAFLDRANSEGALAFMAKSVDDVMLQIASQSFVRIKYENTNEYLKGGVEGHVTATSIISRK